MHPAVFVELDFDAIGRIYLVNFVFVFYSMPKSEKNFPHPLAAIFKGGFLAGVVLWVERECEKQLTADIRQPIPEPRQHFVDANGMKPRRRNEFLDGLLAENVCG